jgi:hypothetical protein
LRIEKKKGGDIMSRRTTGVIFVGISAFLYATRFIAAAIWGSGFSSWNAENFRALLEYVDQGLTPWSIAALVLGLLFLIWGEINQIAAEKRSSPE